MAEAIPPQVLWSQPAGAGAGLRPGQSVLALVRSDPQGLHLLLGTQRVPLPAGSGLEPGQPVVAQRVDGPEGPVIRVGLPPGGTVPGAAATAPGIGALARLLPTLGQLQTPPGFERAVPPAIAPLAQPLRQWLTVLLLREAPGADLARLSLMLRDAAAGSAVPKGWADGLAATLAGSGSGEAAALRGLLARWAGARPAEAWLARGMVPPGDAGWMEPRALVAMLRGHASFRAHLRGAGLLGEFDGLAERILDRSQGALWQNLRALEQPYAFLSLPFAPESGLVHAHVHLFPDSESMKQGAPASHMVVLDCATTRLGDLWVTLRTTGPACQCVFRAAAPETRAALAAESGALAEALEAAGFRPAAVRVEAMETDRIAAFTALMGRFGGGDWQA